VTKINHARNSSPWFLRATECAGRRFCLASAGGGGTVDFGLVRPLHVGPEMSTNNSKQRLSYTVLCAALIVVTILFGVRARYMEAVYYVVAALQFTAICLASWFLGARMITSGGKSIECSRSRERC